MEAFLLLIAFGILALIARARARERQHAELPPSPQTHSDRSLDSMFGPIEGTSHARGESKTHVRPGDVFGGIELPEQMPCNARGLEPCPSTAECLSKGCRVVRGR
jgi:hypothetical protein